MMNMEVLTRITQVTLVLAAGMCFGNIVYTELQSDRETLSSILGGAISRRRRIYRMAKTIAANSRPDVASDAAAAHDVCNTKEKALSLHPTITIQATVKPIEGGRRFCCYDLTEEGFVEHRSK